ncbi:hypothetical protein JOB18_045751 [Solea senegalensis]|uniref:Uncharacterized protein n=1 Tax=Solea senegalensis TaxID=28829 RepID=A0AAV6R2U9_SOLSE|nr:hypothetical protein JOB18_045751 [Solea senegalensis]
MFDIKGGQKKKKKKKEKEEKEKKERGFTSETSTPTSVELRKNLFQNGCFVFPMNSTKYVSGGKTSCGAADVVGGVVQQLQVGQGADVSAASRFCDEDNLTIIINAERLIMQLAQHSN